MEVSNHLDVVEKNNCYHKFKKKILNLTIVLLLIKDFLIKNVLLNVNPKSQKSPKFTLTLKGVLTIFNFSNFRIGVKKS